MPAEHAADQLQLPVVAVIVTSGNAVLVTRRKDGRPSYGFVAGEIKPGEHPAQAAEREVREETGLQVRAGDEIGRRIHPATGRALVYVAAFPAGPRTEVSACDGSGLGAVFWADLAEAERLMPGVFPPVRVYLARALRAPSPADHLGSGPA